jgi:hypothetical protein
VEEEHLRVECIYRRKKDDREGMARIHFQVKKDPEMYGFVVARVYRYRIHS